MSNSVVSHYRKRKAAECRFFWFCRSAMLLALTVLGVLLFTIIYRALPAFNYTEIALHVDFQPLAERYPDTSPPISAFTQLAYQALYAHFPEANTTSKRRELVKLLSSGAGPTIKSQWDMERTTNIANEETVTIWVPASSLVTRAVNHTNGRKLVSDQLNHYIDALEQESALQTRFNTVFFTHADSRHPEQAGFLGAMTGSLLTMLICMLIAFPFGVATAVYLEEFARKSKWMDSIEVSINNLAAVPSIIYGLLGLAIFLNFMHLPRSSPLVGGITLSLLTLPIIIIATRAALRAVPNTLRDAARALGATPLQVVLHHTLPLSLPGIMTGTILGMARALGETAPLLMIGMVAFVADVPASFTSPSTVMPVQIFLWASSPETGFIEKTAAGILVLLLVLLVLNALAIYIRNRFSIRW